MKITATGDTGLTVSGEGEGLELTVDWPGLKDERRSTVRRLAAACPVHETLHRGTEITVAVGGP